MCASEWETTKPKRESANGLLITIINRDPKKKARRKKNKKKQHKTRRQRYDIQAYPVIIIVIFLLPIQYSIAH